MFSEKSSSNAGSLLHRDTAADVPQDTALAGNHGALLPDLIRHFDRRQDFRDNGISLDEMDEIRTFLSFLSSHVRQNRIRDVSCMLLWAEWVRFSLKHARKFPAFIREKELQGLIVDVFGFGIALDEERGMIYPGIHFVPRGKAVVAAGITGTAARA